MNEKPLTHLALSSALWLAMLPAFSFAQSAPPEPTPSEQAQIFLNAGSLTNIEPLLISFHPQQILLEEENMKSLRRWLIKVKKMNLPIHIYSYATPPMARRDMTENSAHQRAMRKAFNRALEAKIAIEGEGINENKIALHALGPTGDNPMDRLRITIRRD
ncbi:hypothetical protein [Pseudemcibacter aquimaris]|uniref:hypothetical protein n=1 Tax=Pseudemcibacter aquimaris TaxID=2857064 RepID=UPI002011C492|nr:hypothetical protein [Pseudemcibacter aquimaris]MCC3860038.1 hypothetical protein [Pseudemcibacter aquimaris]WDU57368.1 hypothetical protein KW060_09170 [Pseudemcibacter aquimaris]